MFMALLLHVYDISSSYLIYPNTKSFLCVIFPENKTALRDGNVAGSEIGIEVGDAAGDIHI